MIEHDMLLPEPIWTLKANMLRQSSALRLPSNDVGEPFTLPWSTIKELSSMSKKNEHVDLDVADKTVALSWNVNGVPQQKTVPSLGLTDKRLPVTSLRKLQNVQ